MATRFWPRFLSHYLALSLSSPLTLTCFAGTVADAQVRGPLCILECTERENKVVKQGKRRQREIEKGERREMKGSPLCSFGQQEMASIRQLARVCLHGCYFFFYSLLLRTTDGSATVVTARTANLLCKLCAGRAKKKWFPFLHKHNWIIRQHSRYSTVQVERSANLFQS